MNIYFGGMCISMAAYILIGIFISRKIHNAEDYYVAGRRAPVLLIAGSLIASYTSTGMFMGDAAQAYAGSFTSMLLLGTMQTIGYILGAVLFGRYLRRMKVMTIPEYFGKRFCSVKMKYLAAITAVVTMTVYLLSVMQGIGTLMSTVTGVSYALCITLALIVFAVLTILSGSRGVLITDTMMAALFTGALVIGAIIVAVKAGGWNSAIAQVTHDPATSKIFSWGGQPGSLYMSGLANVGYGLVYGIVWMSVCMVGPWQTSRYLMAKDEHTAIRSAYPAAIGVFFLELLCFMMSIFVHCFKPELESNSHVLIWASMNLLPKILGVIVLTGVLAAGISSATTFLSLIGASVSNDLAGERLKKRWNPIRLGQIVMAIVSIIVLLLSIFNPPSIFWIMFMGGAIVASSWMPVALASVLSRRLTKQGAFCGMLTGFLICFILKLYQGISGAELPVYLDPSLMGIIFNIIVMAIVSSFTKVTPEEDAVHDMMFVMPEAEKDPAKVKKTLAISKWSFLMGAFVIVILLVLWVIPYLRAL